MNLGTVNDFEWRIFLFRIQHQMKGKWGQTTTVYLSDLVPRARVTLVGEPWGGLRVLAPVGHDPLKNRVGQGLTRQNKEGRCNAVGNHFCVSDSSVTVDAWMNGQDLNRGKRDWDFLWKCEELPLMSQIGNITTMLMQGNESTKNVQYTVNIEKERNTDKERERERENNADG